MSDAAAAGIQRASALKGHTRCVAPGGSSRMRHRERRVMYTFPKSLDRSPGVATYVEMTMNLQIHPSPSP